MDNLKRGVKVVLMALFYPFVLIGFYADFEAPRTRFYKIDWMNIFGAVILQLILLIVWLFWIYSILFKFGLT